MKFNKQKFLHNPKNGIIGDCHRTAIACILDLEPKEVPHFMGDFWVEDCTNGTNKANQAFDNWLKENNLILTHTCYECSLEYLLECQLVQNPDAVYILGGMSKNGTNHSVVGKGGEIIWDPAIDDSGIVGPMDDGYFWVSYIIPINYKAKLTEEQDEIMNGIVSDLETLCRGIDIGTKEPLFAAQTIDLTHSVKKRLETLWEEISYGKG